nr:DNA phosphorothioation-associated putative methyltransferase [Acaryochloris sp. CCMEE 5410]
MYEQQAHRFLGGQVPFTLIKFQFDKPSISYLYYPEFERDPHPKLHASTQVDTRTGKLDYQDFSQRSNPPVLHRKETFLSPNHPLFQQFALLTRQQELLGLLEDSRKIGTLMSWQQRLSQSGIEVHDHVLACPLKTSHSTTVKRMKKESSQPTPTMDQRQNSSTLSTRQIDRHRAAIVRHTLSKPVRLALEAGLFQVETTFFDYGCGHGGDIQQLANQGYATDGWDPYYRPNQDKHQADIVNLGYIINVIEDQRERRAALVEAWNLTNKILIVSAQVLVNDRNQDMVAYEDGIITSRNTFQKYYEQEELKVYIDQILNSEGQSVDAIPVALGIYFVFRDEAQAQIFRASRFRSRTSTPHVRLSIRRFEECKELLAPLMDFFTERGRLPIKEEVEEFAALQEQFGTIKRAFKLVYQATDINEWDAITDTRRNDLLVYLALRHFDKRPKFKDLSPVLQHDIKGLFGSYQQACAAADLMLMSIGNLELLSQRAQISGIGIKHPTSFWVHVSVLDQLDPLLRLYEGCASRTLGRPDRANIIKFSLNRPRISYLEFPTFDTDPHPPLLTSMQIDLQDLHVRYRDFDVSDNPFVLSQKDQLLSTDYPHYKKFAKLTKQESDWGLLDNPRKISDLRSLHQSLYEHCAELKGHRLVWRKDADPLKLKYRKSQARKRQKVLLPLDGSNST